MNKYLKYALILAATLALLFGAALAIVSLMVNPNDYKPLIIKMVKEQKDRTLTLDGDIKLKFFPRLGLDLGRAALSEHGSAAEFARIGSLRLYVAWMPLLSKKLEIDSIAVDGIKANLVRYADGKTNFDDFTQTQPEGKSEISFDIQKLDIDGSAVSFDDRLNGRNLQVSEMNLHSGRIKDGVPTEVQTAFSLGMNQPKIQARIALKTGLLFELDRKHYSLSDIQLESGGEAAGITNLDAKLTGSVDQSESGLIANALKLDLKGNQGGEPIEVKLDAPQLALTRDQVSSGKISLALKKSGNSANLLVSEMKGSGKSFDSPQVALEFAGKSGESAVDGKLTTALSGNLESLQFDLKKINAAIRLQKPGLPNGKLESSMTGDAHLDLKQQDVAANLAARLDDSNIKGTIGVGHFSAPAYRFDLAVDRLDADRYQAKTPKPAAAASAPQSFDLSALRDLNATGSLKFGELKVSNIRMQNVRIDIKAGDGKLEANPLAANLYQGSMTGSVSAQAAKTPQFAVHENLRGISIGPLLKDAVNKDMLEGRGSVSIDAAAAGANLGEIKKAINGTASLSLADGAVKGINIAETLRNFKQKFSGTQGQQTVSANSAEKTDFAELKASFRIQNGVAHNDDLSLKSPLLRLGGAGDIDIGQDRMNYLAKVTVVGTLQGQGGAELSQLKGLTVPVRLSGPFDSLSYSIDVGALAQGLVKGRVEQKKEEVKQQLQQRLKGGLKGLF